MEIGLKVALVGAQYADRRNMKHLVYRIGEILEEQNLSEFREIA